MFIQQQYAEALTTCPPAGCFGLGYRPSLAPTFDDDADRHFDTGIIKPVGGMFSHENAELLRLLLQLQQPKAILEIGVHNHYPSSSECLIRHKPHDSTYFGVDIRTTGRDDVDKAAVVHDPARHCFFIQCDSSNRTHVQRRMAEQGVRRLDMLFIDGLHSINQVLRDWRYAELLNIGGLAILHDTNYHPGPSQVLKAVDPMYFSETVHFADGGMAVGTDYGMAVLRRLR